MSALATARAAVAGADYEGALAPLREALAQCPNHVRSHLLYRDVAEIVGGDAAVEMRAFYDQDDGSPIGPFMRAGFAEDDYTQQQLLNEALARDPSFYWAYFERARMMRRLHRSDKALEALDQAAAAQPNFVEARLERAEILADLGRFAEAAVEYENYTRARPGDRVVVADYARLLIYQVGQTERARDLVERLLEDDPENVDLLMDLAAIYWKAGNVEMAAQNYHRVLELDPVQARAVLNLANLHYQNHGVTADEQRVAWTKARKAFQFFLNMDRPEGIYDVLDLQFAVPFRLAEIEEAIGPGDGNPPQLTDF